MDESTKAIIAFCCCAFGALFILFLWKSRKRHKDSEKWVPYRHKGENDAYSRMEQGTENVEEQESIQRGNIINEEHRKREELTNALYRSEPRKGKQRVAADLAKGVAPTLSVQTAIPRMPREQEKYVEAPQMIDTLTAAMRMQRMARRWTARKEYKKALALWREQEEAYKHLLGAGKVGSLHIGLKEDNNMVVISRLAPAPDGTMGAAEKAGLKKDDAVIMIKNSKRKVAPHCVVNRGAFMEAVGPRSEVFEGTELLMTVIRDKDEQKLWAKSLEDAAAAGLLKTGGDPGAKEKFLRNWMKLVKERRTLEIPVVVGPQSDKARKTRRHHLEERCAKMGLKMNIELVDEFMSDPQKCREYVQKVFDASDEDKSGFLELPEISKVFKNMAEMSGVPPPDQMTMNELFRLMDRNHSGEISFDEFYPYFRSKMVVLIMDNLVADED